MDKGIKCYVVFSSIIECKPNLFFILVWEHNIPYFFFLDGNLHSCGQEDYHPSIALSRIGRSRATIFRCDIAVLQHFLYMFISLNTAFQVNLMHVICRVLLIVRVKSFQSYKNSGKIWVLNFLVYALLGTGSINKYCEGVIEAIQWLFQ